MLVCYRYHGLMYSSSLKHQYLDDQTSLTVQHWTNIVQSVKMPCVGGLARKIHRLIFIIQSASEGKQSMQWWKFCQV